MTVAPEDIDGMPFPTTPTIVREGTYILSIGPEMFTQTRGTEKRIGPPVDTPDPAQIIHPSISTLEKAASIAIFFETLYHALLKPPPTLQAAHPDNYACARERRRLALEHEMEQRQLTEPERQQLRQRWVEAETNNLRERRRRVGLNSFAKMKVIGHGKSRHVTGSFPLTESLNTGAFGVVSLVREKETGALYAMKEVCRSGKRLM
jgi:protein-serine/threonine kinase